MSRSVKIKKRDFENTEKQYKTVPGHLYFKKAAGFDQAGENSDVILEEFFTFELGQYVSVCNSFFKKIEDYRRDDSEHGWYSSIASTINGMRKATQEDTRSALATLPSESTAVLNDMNVVLTNFPASYAFDPEDVGESHHV